ncbi:unnamed protein product [Adineta steineri]|uniref:NR LBD domain-containing protein n=1 Tax=Adineta steineri TaxID=433720 RepID=A0A816AR86_9BILA|nr:unnamed protein product [Adineta steineri]CAF1361482.1 unnamed protein product [Adineta steineri]CAF1412395.1 unnamed protein product [Adineta steineri]CAF1600314.1 unnamed protein product [Adineta steineri]
MPMSTNFSSLDLTLDDWSLINNITHAYDICGLNYDKTRINNYSLTDSTLTDFLNDEQQMYRSLILFYNQIPGFKQLNIEDKILLIKCNITHLIHLHHILKDNFIENPKIGLHMSKWIDSDFHKQMSKTRHSYDYFIEYPIVLKLALIPLMLTINLSRLPFDQLSLELNDKNLIIQYQSLYITLLWKYLNVIYDEKDAIKAVQILIFQLLRYQLLMYEMENIIKKQTNSNQFNPLTKSVLRLN